MKPLTFILLTLTFIPHAQAIKGTSTFSLSEDAKKEASRAPAEDFYLDPDEIDLNDPVAVEKEKTRIRENMAIKRQQDLEFRRFRGAR